LAGTIERPTCLHELVCAVGTKLRGKYNPKYINRLL